MRTSASLGVLLSCPLLALALNGWLGAQPAAAAEPARPAVAAEGEPRFPALEEIDKKEREEQARRFEQKRLVQLADLKRLVQSAVSRISTDDGVSALLRSERTLVQMQQEKGDPRVTAMLGDVRRRIATAPPPRAFQPLPGVEMVLVDAAQPAFYASRRPVTWGTFVAFLAETPAERSRVPADRVRVAADGSVTATDAEAPATQVTWASANAFCEWLGRKAAGRYGLPALPQAKALTPPPAVSLWTSTEWQGPDEAEWRVRSTRLGVVMLVVLDTARVLGAGEAVGDVPTAHYERLGFAVASDLATGVEHRLRCLKAELQP